MTSVMTTAEIGRPATAVIAYATDPTRFSDWQQGVMDGHIDSPGGMDGPIRATVDVLVEPLSESRSRLTISVDFTGHRIGKILVPLMVRREARRDARRPGSTQAETGSKLITHPARITATTDLVAKLRAG
jgi:hypothetical protein